ncbi:ammonia-forming cytochrome c nitrite reductase [Pelagicoccus sp. SDUM812003]|uniref:ammonia-forming cytochrome c nitrite reductase n=1 Tax=Pelagicoccus sp. SDUM812003 TaxID=3041267 RepID=UPI00280CD398|nr:ammonia-forming cytochrome c nitrite reductase [Pelagicoccus sp. SDUM812003]MDQ8202924.1 ammonia-forming cytochrome c nitrite reductase [Pelagicoccus sp. SDUM812003]
MNRQTSSSGSRMGWILFLSTLIGVFMVGFLITSVMERRVEAKQAKMTNPIAQWEPRNEVWGANFPREYEGWKKTLETDFKSAHGGSAKTDYLEEYPNLVILWAGYGFSKAYEQGRGHAHAIDDIRETYRTNAGMPATCWTCKSTDVPRVMNEMGVAEFYDGSWFDRGEQIVNAIGCQDCHDPQNMNLRISRPALAEAFNDMGKNINEATHQEMRSLVCAQCHVEYYFEKEPAKYLKFPWDNGFSAEAMEAYYDQLEFSDWTHKLSRAPMLKAQHPDYELYMTGVHGQRGVSCADCHMPYKSEGGAKFTDHHIQSPLNAIDRSCQVCHRESEATLLTDVYSRQAKVMELRGIVEGLLAKAHIEAKTAWDAGATEEEMKQSLTLIRHAQWRWDWVAAANSAGFHAPNTALQVLGTAIEKAGAARQEIARVLWSHGITEPIEMPDISTKEKAQRFIGLDPEELESTKAEHRQELFPAWDETAAARQEAMGLPDNVSDKKSLY